MTHYVAAYDTESPDCLEAIRTIVAMHEKFTIPATFFLVARLLDTQAAEYVALLRDHPLFEIACHSYSHMVLRDTPGFGLAGPVEQFPHEIADSKTRIEDVFGCRVDGFRPPVCAADGMCEAPEVLRLLDLAGYRYLSSVAWGPQWSLPALLMEPFSYAEQGYPNLWDLPACGWHENLLKGHNNCGPVRIGLFPAAMPETIPTRYVETPEEEIAFNNKPFLDKALADDMPLVSFIWHPWSLRKFDPPMRMLDLTFQYIRERGLCCARFCDVLATMM